MLASSTALALSPSLCWHHHPHSAGIDAHVVLALLPLLRWCCRCLRRGLPRCWRLSICQLNKGEDACELSAKQKHNKGKEARATRTLMLAYWGQQHQHDKGDLDDSKDAWALMTATTSLLQGQQHQLDDHANLTMVETSLQQERQSPLQWQQRRLHINSSNAIAMRATTPLQCQQGCLRTNDDNNAIAMRAMTLAWVWQQCHCKKGNNAVADQGQQHCCRSRATMPLLQGQWHHFDDRKGICTSTMAMMPSSWGQQLQLQQWQNPAHWQQQCHCNVGDNASSITSNNYNDASLTTAEIHLRINNGNNAIMMRATSAIATMAKTPAHWRQQHQLAN
jgi:hypothetical protein